MDLPGNEYDSDNLAALDFSGGGGAEESSIDALDDYAPVEPEDTGTDLDALDGLTEKEEEPELAFFTVTNPQKSVSVTALMDGRIQEVKLTDRASSMAEPALADEIFVIADLARQKARAAQHTLILETMSEVTDGEESALLREFVGMSLNLPTPEEAAAAEAEVFATRYDVDYSKRDNGDND